MSIRIRAECENTPKVEVRQQWTRVIGQDLVGTVNSSEFPTSRIGFEDQLQDNNTLDHLAHFAEGDSHRDALPYVMALEWIGRICARIARRRGGIDVGATDVMTHSED
ncbi:hypothetical protein [Mycobacterium leprae]|uniref:hypothetical protein n=1 Tax=Mycobacterium leprae TaxID=1769 RepID=UPI000301A520